VDLAGFDVQVDAVQDFFIFYIDMQISDNKLIIIGHSSYRLLKITSDGRVLPDHHCTNRFSYRVSPPSGAVSQI
jgi:hypothetical protein